MGGDCPYDDRVTMKRFVLIGLGGLLILTVAGLYIGFRMILPVNPKAEYFPVKESRLGGVKWIFGTFQPVYLKSGKDAQGKTFIKTMYRDGQNKVRFVDVWPERQENLDKLKTGQRFSVSYVRNVISRPEAGDFYAGIRPFSRDDAFLYELCTGHVYMCDLAEYTMQNQQAYWDFAKAGTLPSGVKLRAVGIGVGLSLE